ncbi:hypothetical protein HYPSUDRAFT_838495 [Hypholoma sublateritium FD-334 SS-4]|uniref:Uncharacterized protein n=1 Tax=Hypholoma sublateritium (strain FD-334 SS-4) TaxID=945553 RepID=A0A0D2NMK7_HYPSF|nr:hypothetical protein HYPSUDRAFT_838495 [Hypholoma sublateritium FD-334 SS-4]
MSALGCINSALGLRTTLPAQTSTGLFSLYPVLDFDLIVTVSDVLPVSAACNRLSQRTSRKRLSRYQKYGSPRERSSYLCIKGNTPVKEEQESTTRR